VPGSAQDFIASAGERVYFDYDKFAIRADAKPVLAAQASWPERYEVINPEGTPADRLGAGD
jgi:peptidoglycan-associated lipoprotein